MTEDTSVAIDASDLRGNMPDASPPTRRQFLVLTRKSGPWFLAADQIQSFGRSPKLGVYRTSITLLGAKVSVMVSEDPSAIVAAMQHNDYSRFVQITKQPKVEIESDPAD